MITHYIVTTAVGNRMVFDGLDTSPLMAVNPFSAREFLRCCDRLPAPVTRIRY
ncbi:MAG: hypothetical protein R6T92_00455 [Desulfosalsimonadaceae bacterium]